MTLQEAKEAVEVPRYTRLSDWAWERRRALKKRHASELKEATEDVDRASTALAVMYKAAHYLYQESIDEAEGV